MVRISGRTVSKHAPEKLWQLLRSADVLARSLPGCSRLEEVEPGLYRGVILLGQGLLKGKLHGEVRVRDLDAGTDPGPAGGRKERRCRVDWKARGIAGSVGGFTEVCFASGDGSDQTVISYTGEARPRGLFRAVPPGVFEDAVGSLTGNFFNDLSGERVPT